MCNRLAIAFALALALTAACAGTAPPPSPAPAACVPPIASKTIRGRPDSSGKVEDSGLTPIHLSRLVMGTSVEGRPIEMLSVGRGHDVVLVIAGIHGNEPAGRPLAHALMAHLRQHPELLSNRRVLVLPDANPDGRLARTRTNARGVDVNRNFAAANRRDTARTGQGALSEPESEAIERVVRLYAPHRVLSLHQPLRCVDHDGPALGLAARVAKACGLPVKKLGTRPGSMGAWLGEGLGVPLVTLELPADASRLDDAALWGRYGPALLSFVTGAAGA